MTCPRCGQPMNGGICDNCGFPLRRGGKMLPVKRVKRGTSQRIWELANVND